VAEAGLAAVEAAAAPVGLAVLGAFHPEPGEIKGAGTLVLLGPRAPGFWEVFAASPEHGDGADDPLDRWTVRVLGGLAAALGARALYPFGGPPWPPFIAWAARTGRAWSSPVGLMVHDERGLLVSWRGALALPHRLALPPTGTRPCDGCAAPCLGACPVGALGAGGYDVAACRRFVETEAGRSCREGGCLVRRACPVGRDLVPPDAQAAFHMAAFRGRQGG
jgi:epoxyqueuosine reductase